MRLGALVTLGGVFAFAFAGRAAVLAAKAAEYSGTPGSTSEARHSCVNGPFAEELLAQAERLERQKTEQAAVDQKRQAVLQHVNARIEELEQLNGQLAEIAARNDESSSNSTGRAASLYERMKPELAAAIIAKMDPSFAAGLLKSMNEDRASEILSSVPPERAYAITVLMIGVS